MTLQDLFDQLLSERSVTLVMGKQASESLRVQLVKKFSKYKSDMDAVGFLDPELATCSVSRRVARSDTGELLPDTWTFVLSVRQRNLISYQVLEPTTEPKESEV